MKLKIDTDKFSIFDLHAAWYFIGTIIEQRDPEFFSQTRKTKSVDLEAGTTINGDTANEDLILTPDFDAKDNAPADSSEAARAAPLPPNVAPLPFPVPPGPAPAPEYDSAGVAWDGNVHSSTRSKTIDGRWKARRSRTSPAAEVPAGTTSHSSEGSIIAVTRSSVMPPHVVVQTAFAPPVPPSPQPPIQLAPLPPNLPPPPEVDPSAEHSVDSGELPAAADARIDFPAFIAKITAGMQNGSVTQARIAEVLAKHHMDSLFSLNTHPGQVAALATDFGF